MPVTARLSKRFYDTLGEEIASELVDWFNAVDATYQADLRELNELNFARFEAKLGERLAEVESHLTWRMFAFWALLGTHRARRRRYGCRCDQPAVAMREQGAGGRWDVFLLPAPRSLLRGGGQWGVGRGG